MARPALDLTGKKFGMLTAVRMTGDSTQSRSKLWLCECDCGGTSEHSASHLRSGSVSSCGCLKKGSTENMRVVKTVNEWLRSPILNPGI